MSLWLSLNRRRAPRSFVGYRIAGTHLGTDMALPELAPWRVDECTASGPPSLTPFLAKGEPCRLDPSWLGNRWCAVHFWRSGRQMRLHVEEGGEWLLDFEVSAATRLDDRPCDPTMLTEVALGPILILLLAYRDVFCLHASGVVIAGRAHFFLGDSGRGKSTLARGAPWERLCDDISPVGFNDDEVRVLPHFPQLKLEPSQQLSSREPQDLPVGGLYLLDPDRDDASDGVEAIPLRPSTAARVILGQTVASRLFGPRRVARQLAWAKKLVEQAPVFRLRYGWGMERLPDVRSAISALSRR